MDLTWSLDEVARTSDEAVVRRRYDQRNLLYLLILLLFFAFGLAFVIVRALEFTTLGVSWDSNAYGSIVWFVLGMHALHLLVLTSETLLLLIWIIRREFDMKHRVDVVTIAVYWYWVVGVWLVLFAILYFTPRLDLRT